MAKRKWKDIIKVQPMDWQVFVVRPSSLADFGDIMLHWGCHPVTTVECHHSWEQSLADGGAMFTTWGDNYILALPDEWDHMLVYHEALHCAIHLWDDAGAKLKLPGNEEVLTYTQGHIVKLLIEKFYKDQIK